MYREVNGKPKKRNHTKPKYRLYAVIAALAVVIIFVIVLAVSCGTNKEEAEIETSENGAYTEAENTADSTEGEISASTETETTETGITEETTTEPITIEGISEEEETEANHDIPDVSGLEFPFTTMSLDWGEDDLEGWYHYDIPDEYVQTGGYFPDAVQVYTYILCTQYSIDYPTVLALIEVESGYKYDAVSKSGAMGYMQVVPSYHYNRLSVSQSDEAFINPYLNIDAGISYLVELYERFESSEMVLTAYHYGVTGSYRDYWNNGEAGSPYSDEVLEIAERIRSDIYGD